MCIISDYLKSLTIYTIIMPETISCLCMNNIHTCCICVWLHLPTWPRESREPHQVSSHFFNKQGLLLILELTVWPASHLHFTRSEIIDIPSSAFYMSGRDTNCSSDTFTTSILHIDQISHKFLLLQVKCSGVLINKCVFFTLFKVHELSAGTYLFK